VDGAIELEALNDAFTQLGKRDPVEFWTLMEELGYDLWLNHASYAPFEHHRIVNIKTMSRLNKLIENHMCKEEQELLFFSPYYIRFDNHKNILNLNANL
jgi:hypothetical protein